MASILNKAKELYSKGKYETALAELMSIESGEVDSAELSYYLGLCYTHLKRFDEALLYLEQVVSSEMGFLHVYQARMLLGYIYSVTQRYRLAEFEFNRLLETGYESTMVLSAFAYVKHKQGDYRESVKLLEQALKLEPENPNTLNSLGYIMADSDERPGVALQYCRRAVQLRPDHPSYLDSLGWAYYKAGKRQDAMSSLRKALTLSPSNQEIAIHLKKVVESV